MQERLVQTCRLVYTVKTFSDVTAQRAFMFFFPPAPAARTCNKVSLFGHLGLQIVFLRRCNLLGLLALVLIIIAISATAAHTGSSYRRKRRSIITWQRNTAILNLQSREYWCFTVISSNTCSNLSLSSPHNQQTCIHEVMLVECSSEGSCTLCSQPLS